MGSINLWPRLCRNKIWGVAVKRGLNRASLIVGLQLTVVCLLVVLFQNCGPGFDPAASQTKSNSLGGGNSTPPPQAGTLEPVDEPPGIPRFNGPPPPTSFTKNAKLSAIALNTALDLGAFTCPGIEGGLPDGCRRLMEYSGFTYDFHRHEMLMFGGGHATVMNNDVLRFDFGELVWKGSYTPNSCASHTAANFDSATALFKDTGRPASTHTYDQLVISKRDGNLVKLFAGGLSGAVCNSQDAYWEVVVPYIFLIQTPMLGVRYSRQSPQWITTGLRNWIQIQIGLSIWEKTRLESTTTKRISSSFRSFIMSLDCHTPKTWYTFLRTRGFII